MVFLILVHVHGLHFNKTYTYPTPNLSYINTSKLTWNKPLLWLFSRSLTLTLYPYSKPEKKILFILTHENRDIGPAVRVFANGPGDLGSIPGRVIPKTLKMVLDTTLLNTQHYKVRFKGKVEQSWEWSSALPYTLV